MATPISSPGVYSVTGDAYLANDINVAGGTALTFTQPVRLNLAGRTVRNTAPHPTELSIGIKATAANNVAVFGGAITGFRHGVDSDTPWTRLERVDLSGNLYIGANLKGHTSRVLSCVVDGIGGVSDEAYAIALNIAATGGIVDGNSVLNIYRQALASSHLVGEGCPIVINAAAGNCFVSANFLENDVPADDTIGIFAGSGGQHTIERNVIRAHKTAIMGGGVPSSPVSVHRNALWMPAALASSVGVSAIYGLAEENLIVGFDAAVPYGIPQSGNTVH